MRLKYLWYVCRWGSLHNRSSWEWCTLLNIELMRRRSKPLWVSRRRFWEKENEYLLVVNRDTLLHNQDLRESGPPESSLGEAGYGSRWHSGLHPHLWLLPISLFAHSQCPKDKKKIPEAQLYEVPVLSFGCPMGPSAGTTFWVETSSGWEHMVPALRLSMV
jgi:hypothetical protein